MAVNYSPKATPCRDASNRLAPKPCFRVAARMFATTTRHRYARVARSWQGASEQRGCTTIALPVLERPSVSVNALGSCESVGTDECSQLLRRLVGVLHDEEMVRAVVHGNAHSPP
jgi:hypothetical protein